MIAEPDTLERCPFFECFRPKHLEQISELATRLTFKPDQIIFNEGEVSTHFYVVVSGRVALEATVGERKICIQTLFSGDELGWSAMVDGRRQCQARALDLVELLSFESARLREACDQNLHLAKAFLERLLSVVAERLQSTRLQLTSALAAAPPSQRIRSR